MSQHSYTNTESVLAKWTPLSATVAETSSTTQVTVLSGEAFDLSFLIEEHWEPVVGATSRPGSKQALVSEMIEPSVAEDIRELNVAMTHTHSQFRAVMAANWEAPVDRAARRGGGSTPRHLRSSLDPRVLLLLGRGFILAARSRV